MKCKQEKEQVKLKASREKKVIKISIGINKKKGKSRETFCKTKVWLLEKINETDKLLARLRTENTPPTAEMEEKHINHINIRMKQII